MLLGYIREGEEIAAACHRSSKLVAEAKPRYAAWSGSIEEHLKDDPVALARFVNAQPDPHLPAGIVLNQWQKLQGQLRVLIELERELEQAIPAELYAELDPLSDAEIETRLPLFTEQKRQLARSYLEERAVKRVRGALAEQVEIARSAKDAAWVSAKAAKGANTRATVALIVSIATALFAARGYIKPLVDAAVAWFASH